MAGQRLILVERRLHGEKSLLHELESLAEAAGHQVLGRLEQVRGLDSRFQIGRGKAEELARMVKELGAERVVFENELKPVQAYNLAKLTGVEVVSKFQLILEVFTQHASTREANLQIELARLRYELARAKEKVRLAKKGEQPGFHGLGKYEVNVYYDAIRRRVSRIEAELRKIRKERTFKRLRREVLGFPTVSLSGYTAAGKSTLFNALAGGKEKVTGSLFTTLSPKISSVSFRGKKAMLVDTVGFIDRLPLTLIEAFKSTLEETVFSSLIILVVDCSESVEEVRRKLKCCLDTLREIGAASTPMIVALNKADLVGEAEARNMVEHLRDLAPNPLLISALYGWNLEELKEAVSDHLRNFLKASFELPLNSASLSLISNIRRFSTVLNQDFQGKTILLEVESADYLMDKIKGRVENIGGKMLEAVKV